MFGIFGNNNGNRHVIIKAPMSGKVVDLSDLPDEVFAQKMVGDGIAIEPWEGIVAAPFDGRVKQIFPTGHALVLESKEGLAVLIHIGLDTVNLKGKGFRVLVKEGSNVNVGTALMEFDPELIEKNNYPLKSPIIMPEGQKIKYVEFTEERKVKRGQDVLMKVQLR
ncbi:MAG: PTS glucose transporter subunit IIA [Thermoanaerobacteraceae bacterium]|nr:PTS glucose transporter subunit IIA [Thermoanaerobacteraceae bacterium]